MKVRLSDDKLFIRIIEASKLELDQLKLSFTKKIENWYIMKKKNPNWNCEICFFDRYLRIPFGLWKELLLMCKEYNFPFIQDEVINFYDKTFDENVFEDWIARHFYHDDSEIKPYSHQYEGAKRAIKYMNCTEEISTSGGKTFISYIIFNYLFSVGKVKKLLYIVPSVGLVSQGEGDFYEYAELSNNKPTWKSQTIYSGKKTNKELIGDVIFATYQSLANKEIDYFKDVDIIICDEAHHASSSSYRNIISNCINAKYKIGLTGTLPKDGTCKSFTIQSYLGPMVFQLTSFELIENEQATPIRVRCIDMDYLDEELKKKLLVLREHPDKDGNKLLNLEKGIMRDSRERLVFVCTEVSKSEKNALVLFQDILDGYGRKIYNWLRENVDGRTIYYIDGSTTSENREYIKTQMEQRNDVILVASMGTFSEGISVKNLHYIYLAECGKSETIAAQILGRGMRLLSDKEEVVVVDFIDNYVYGSNQYKKNNYLYRHGLERQQIYGARRFPFTVEKVKI